MKTKLFSWYFVQATLHVERARVDSSRFSTRISSITPGIFITRCGSIHLQYKDNEQSEQDICNDYYMASLMHQASCEMWYYSIDLVFIYTSFNWPQDGKRESAGRGGRPAPRLWRTQWPWHAGHSDGLNPSAQWALPLSPRTPVTSLCLACSPSL